MEALYRTELQALETRDVTSAVVTLGVRNNERSRRARCHYCDYSSRVPAKFKRIEDDPLRPSM